VKPYYEHAGITILHGDARELISTLPAEVESVITDPVWPNASPLLRGADDPLGLFADVMRQLPESVLCLTVHLGVLSDPRILRSVPARLPYFRTCWLPMVPVSFSGRAVNGNDVAYVYGQPPGKGMIGGECKACGERPLFPRKYGRNRAAKQYNAAQAVAPHPAPRKLGHVRWLMARFGRGIVCDPFAGAGTTLLAAKANHLPAIGIEIEERYCELAAKRLSQEVLNFQIT
jgi:hypothetical protein